MKKERLFSETPSKTGTLIVITGASGAGKDAVMQDLLKKDFFEKNNIKQVVTCADRQRRSNEVDGLDYHFVSSERLIEMEKNGELAEPRKLYGKSYKATPKIEIERFVNGESLVWRIDPSLASQVASGEFFKREFPDKADLLQKHTIVIFITAPKGQIVGRRKDRDGENYRKNAQEYQKRDNQDKEYLNILSKSAINVNNLDGRLRDTVDSVIKYVLKFNEKYSND